MGTATASAAAQSRRQPIDWSATAARDRLSSTVFLAALFHGIVILGVTFGGPDPGFSPATTLDVVIVTRDQRPAIAPEDATALAQQNLDGAGNTAETDQLRTAVARSAPAPAIGPDRVGARDQRDPGESTPRQAAVVTSLVSDRAVGPAREEGEAEPVEQQSALAGAPDAVELVNEPDSRTLITASGPRELVVSARTRESRIARYLSGWKSKVERIGTLNFPRQAATRELTGNPTLEVAIAANGTLREVLIRQSSGQRRLDEAAIEILRLAAPFEPFPDYLREDYDVLRFAYEWRFSEGGKAAGLMVARGT